MWGTETGGARRGPGEGAGGGSPVWSPGCRPPARSPAPSLAIPSKAPEISVLSACGNVVWRKVVRRPRTPAPAPPPPGPPPPAPAPSPPRPPPPPSSDRARHRSPAGANLEQPPGPSGKKLGAVGTEGSIPFSVLEPRSCQGVWILGGRRKELAGFGESSSGAQREPAAVPGARIAARLEAESALGNCLQR